MLRTLSAGLVLLLTLLPVQAQRPVQPITKEVRTAKSVALVNHTHTDAVEQGAVEALKLWGRFTVIDDLDSADIVLTFDKKNERTGSNTQSTNPNGQTNSGFSMSFGSSIHMKAVAKGSAASFYTGTTSDSKKKAGAECVLGLQQAFNPVP